MRIMSGRKQFIKLYQNISDDVLKDTCPCLKFRPCLFVQKRNDFFSICIMNRFWIYQQKAFISAFYLWQTTMLPEVYN